MLYSTGRVTVALNVQWEVVGTARPAGQQESAGSVKGCFEGS
jgi:hypothetical protein